MNYSYKIYQAYHTIVVVGFKDGGIIYIIDEIFLEGGSDTRMMATEIKKRYGGCNPIVVGDGTGNNKRSIINIRQTSYTIFKEEGLRTENFTNPHVVKRISNLNRCLFNNVLIIDPICKHLIRDLELVVYAKNSNEIDKNMDKTLTHISDALSYMCFKLDPPKDYNQKSTSYAI